MGVDLLKKLKSDATRRQQNGYFAKEKPKYDPPHKYFVSNNWKALLERKPLIAPKAAASEILLPLRGQARTNVVAMDCEMVGVGARGEGSVLARVSIVSHDGSTLLDAIVKPKEYVTDYRTPITGLTAASFYQKGVLEFDDAKRRAAEIMEGKIVVGHAVHHDFEVLDIAHPRTLVRDTSMFKPLRPPSRRDKLPSLALLSMYWLQETIHDSSHDSVEDARMALQLYQLHSRQWEKMMLSAMRALQKGMDGVGIPKAANLDDGGESIERQIDSAVAQIKGGSQKRRMKKKKRVRTIDAAVERPTSSIAADNSVDAEAIQSIETDLSRRKRRANRQCNKVKRAGITEQEKRMKTSSSTTAQP